MTLRILMPLVSHQTIRNLLPTHLIDANTAPEITRQVADNVVEASLKGHDSHGVTLLPRYLKAIQKGHPGWRTESTRRVADPA
ncbi:Ldh family oxidoreductase [Pantoea sp. B65]|uniref:Ldh family oxidoreductase n=1 Tax=Pantoea sp. B65 TaxID=2813359 RepID=UPI0039B55FCF